VQTGYRRNNGGYDTPQPAAGRIRIHRAYRAGRRWRKWTLQSLENLPIGVDGSAYQWTDLHGEGIPGILTEQAAPGSTSATWSPSRQVAGRQRVVEFAPLETVASSPMSR
jgi:hypothetical protein